MNISSNLYVLFNTQYNRELQNAEAYAQLATSADATAWDGFAKLLSKSSGEEREHAEKIRSFLVDRNTVPAISEHPAPEGAGPEPRAWVSTALSLEQANTALLLQLYKDCEVERDIEACVFLQWFLTEQRVSEREWYDLFQQVQRTDAALLLIDDRLGE